MNAHNICFHGEIRKISHLGAMGKFPQPLIMPVILFQLAVKSDILLENYLPGKLPELGLGYEQLAEIAPGLVYCSITGLFPSF